MTFPRALSRRVAVLVVCTVSVGCDSTTILPPPEVPGPAPSTVQSSTTTIDLILDRADLGDQDVLTRPSRIRSAYHRVILDVASLTPSDPPAKQAEAIRAAVARKTSVLIVRPVDAPEVTEALRNAQAQGIPLVLLDRNVPGLSEASPVTLVTYAPFAESAAQLVAATKAAANREKLRDDGVAILLVNTLTDPHTSERVEALRKAIADGGLTLADTLEFSGISQRAQPPLLAKLDADPKVTMIFAEEDQGLASTHHTARLLIAKRRFTVAGYFNFSKKTAKMIREEATAVADRGEDAFAIQAIDAAVKRSRGEPVPARIEITHPVDIGTHGPTPLVD